MKISTRLALAQGGLMAASFIAATMALGGIGMRRAAQAVHDRFYVEGAVLTNVLQMGIDRNDHGLFEYVDWLPRERGWQYFMIVDGHGGIRMHSDHSYVGRPVLEWEAAAVRSPLEFRQHLTQHGHLWGTVRVGLGREEYDRAVRAAWLDTLRPLLPIAAAGLALSALLGAWLARYLCRTIDDMSEAARRLGAGERDVEVAVRSSDEMGALARQFNAMASQVTELDILKDDLVAAVSHDLRNPLASVQLGADALLDGAPGALAEEQRRMVELMSRGAAQLGRMIENVLDMAKVKAGRFEIERQPFDLAELLRETLALFEVQAQQRRVRLELVAAADIPPVLGDAMGVGRVVSNLLGNAFKFTPENGRIAVEASAQNGEIRVSVSDTGFGIAPEDLPRLFQRFERLEPQEQKRRRISGAGLGLAVSKHTIEAHGGRIWVESKKGEGTRVSFTLPPAPR